MKPNIEQQYHETTGNVKSHHHHHHHSRNGGGHVKPTKSYERKRTANLESLIGNLKVRKMNQPDTGDQEDDLLHNGSTSSGHSSGGVSSSSSSHSSNKNKLNSLFVEVTNSLSDCCSRSTPPLSSASPTSSISPTSSAASMSTPDSPVQSNASSSFSSLSSSAAQPKCATITTKTANATSSQLLKLPLKSTPSSNGIKREPKSNSNKSQENGNDYEHEDFYQHDVKKESFRNDDEEDEEEYNDDEDEMNFNHSSSPSTTAEQHNSELMAAADTIKDTINAISSLAWNTVNNQKSSSSNNTPNEEEEFDEDVEEEDEDDQDIVKLPPAMLTVTSTPVQRGGLVKKEAKHVNKNHFNYKITHAGGSGAKNADDGGRAVKFYDDFIDFRGDILRRPPNSKNCRILWEYLFLLLQDINYSSVIKWEDETNMVFRIVQAEKLAALWGLQKNRLGMTYEKLSRGMRYYYPNNIIAREPGRRLLYRFMRHPDEIKKFVKKNGTYMLKKTTKSKSGDGEDDEDEEDEEEEPLEMDESAPADDSGVDEPLPTMVAMANNNKPTVQSKSKSKQPANRVKKESCDDEGKRFNDNNYANNNSSLSSSKSSSSSLSTAAAAFMSQLATTSPLSRLPSPPSLHHHQTNGGGASGSNSYYHPELYPYLYSAQMAAAASYISNLMSSNSVTPSATNSISVPSTVNQEDAAAQFFMQHYSRNNNNNNASSESPTPSLNDQMLMYLKCLNANANGTSKSPLSSSSSSFSSSSSSSSANTSSSGSTHSLDMNFSSHNNNNNNSSNNSINYASNKKLFGGGVGSGKMLIGNNDPSDHPLNLTINRPNINNILIKKAKK